MIALDEKLTQRRNTDHNCDKRAKDNANVDEECNTPLKKRYFTSLHQLPSAIPRRGKKAGKKWRYVKSDYSSQCVDNQIINVKDPIRPRVDKEDTRNLRNLIKQRRQKSDQKSLLEIDAIQEPQKEAKRNGDKNVENKNRHVSHNRFRANIQKILERHQLDQLVYRTHIGKILRVWQREHCHKIRAKKIKYENINVRRASDMYALQLYIIENCVWQNHQHCNNWGNLQRNIDRFECCFHTAFPFNE